MPVDTSAPLREILEDYKGKSGEELYSELQEVPFFMNDYKEDDEENPQIEALRALAYEGEPWEIAENFKNQGNECFKQRKYKDAAQFYTQALSQQTEREDINVACLGNRAQCNLELKNLRKCITDCSRVLDIQPENLKAWFRSAKAFLLLDKVDESIVCAERGLEHDKTNEGLLGLKSDAEKRKMRLIQLKEDAERRQEHKELVKRTLELAISSRKLKSKYTITNYDNSNPGNLRCSLENDVDANSTLYMPVLALYPLAMESDIMQSVDESVTIGDIIDQLFTQPPPWADSDYAIDNLECYVQTESGGLAKVGRKFTLLKAFSTPNVVMIDNMARLYVVPKSKSSGWLKDWNKDAQSKLLRD